eukprot:Skav215289  [mRNA]  locus=scaffold2522:195737:198668:- [translate_table: standard]
MSGGLLLYGVGFIAYVANITWRYPALVNDGHGLKLLSQYRFLFGRFKEPEHPEPQHHRLIFFLLIASFLVGGTDSRTRTFIGVILMLLVLAIASALAMLVARALYKKFFPGKIYDMFLCHHKAGAGVLCRWLKSELLRQSQGHAKVFLDSDELEGLADIGEIVKSQSETQVRDFGHCGEQDDSDPALVFRGDLLGSGPPGVPLVEFNAFGTECQMVAAVASLLPPVHRSSRASITSCTSGTSAAEIFRAQIAILGQVASSEGRLTSLVLKSMVMERLRRPIVCVTTVDEAGNVARKAQYILVVLTGGLFQDKGFLKMLEAFDEANPQLEILGCSGSGAVVDELTRRFKFSQKSSSDIGFTSERNDARPQHRDEDAEEAADSDKSDDLGPVELAEKLLETNINFEC